MPLSPLWMGGLRFFTLRKFKSELLSSFKSRSPHPDSITVYQSPRFNTSDSSRILSLLSHLLHVSVNDNTGPDNSIYRLYRYWYHPSPLPSSSCWLFTFMSYLLNHKLCSVRTEVIFYSCLVPFQDLIQW